MVEVSNGGFKLGGADQIVEIDESLFVRRKYHRGRLISQQWVFGMYDLNMKYSVLVCVPNCDRETLFPIIRKYIAPGSNIWSELWKAYSTLPKLPENYLHGTVNHSENFKDPETGRCIDRVFLLKFSLPHPFRAK